MVLNQIRGEVLRIGRGTNADLRSEDATVALEHAIIENTNEGYRLVDRGSITGTYLNGKPIESGILSPGDVVEIGSLRLRVQAGDPKQPMFLKVETVAPESMGAGIGAEAATSALAAAPEIMEGRQTVVAPRVNYVRAYQLKGSVFTKATVVFLCVAAASAAILGVVHQRNEVAFRPGALSSAHTTVAIATNCAACHEPWQGVPDKKCMTCHANPEHSEVQVGAPSCTGCHFEHREFAQIQRVADSTCAACHANLQVREGSTRFARSIHSFGADHPEFALTVQSDQGVRRVRINEREARQSDGTPLEFNHQLHLKEPLSNASGQQVQLACQDCHRPVEANGQTEPEPLSFEAHCQSCHTLTFDRRFPDTQVPHGGDPTLIYSFIANVYSGNRDVVATSPQQARRRLLARSGTSGPGIGQQALAGAEQVLKTKCEKCHQIERMEGRLQVTAPKFRDQWFTHSIFRHQSHLGIDCQDCHKARESSNTSDALMPGIAECRKCHARTSVAAAGIMLAAVSNTASGSCITCHVYHERSREGGWQAALILPASTGPAGSTDPTLLGSPWILVGAVVLGLILLAVYLERRRIRTERLGDTAPGKRAAAKKVPAPAPAAKAPPPPPPPAAPAPPEATLVVPLPGRTMMVDMEAPPAPGGTEMIQWHGTLRWTGGPLMGQKIPITGEGFWIGRDGDLSQIVINDNRISRKHTFIGPREGKMYVRDEGSTNGTYINSTSGDRITEVELKAGDQVILGEAVASFEYIP